MGGYLLDLLSDALKKQEGEAENRNYNVVFQGLLFLWVQDLRNRCTSYTASVISLTAMSEILVCSPRRPVGSQAAACNRIS